MKANWSKHYSNLALMLLYFLGVGQLHFLAISQQGFLVVGQVTKTSLINSSPLHTVRMLGLGAWMNTWAYMVRRRSTRSLSRRLVVIHLLNTPKIPFELICSFIQLCQSINFINSLVNPLVWSFIYSVSDFFVHGEIFAVDYNLTPLWMGRLLLLLSSSVQNSIQFFSAK